MQKIVVVDYGMGNISSVARKLNRLKVDCIAANQENEILSADKIILPGVGHFSKAMENIESLGLINVLNEAVLVKKKPILGICLGMQLMARISEEGNAKGLGWFDAEVKKFKVDDTLKYKIPHIGWNTVSKEKESFLMKSIESDSSFYFVHSFYLKANDSQDILNKTNYATDFTSAIEKENIFGTQYHPEKSHSSGNQLFKNFIEL